MTKLPVIQTLLIILLTSCLSSKQTTTPTAIMTFPAFTTIPTLAPAFTVTPLPTDAATQLSVTMEPEGCLKPVDDYMRVEVNGQTLNQRTLSMLGTALNIYGGELEIDSYAITQGSYTNSVSASFGTHAGGGAVDLSVLRRGTYTVLWDDVEPLIHALRLAGFAAWLREYGELYEDSPIHIHAIAIGDRELSEAAQEQLIGEAGYFRGLSGLTDVNGVPGPDRYGGPILCGWMFDRGYRDMR